jgi:branched-chain amino acid transport system permease protein
LSGLLIAPLYGVRFNIGLNLGVAGFVAAVIGGLGSTRGAIVGGYLVGLVEGAVGVFSSRAETYRPIVVFAVFVLVLTLRPTGLLGRRTVEKV